MLMVEVIMVTGYDNTVEKPLILLLEYIFLLFH